MLYSSFTFCASKNLDNDLTVQGQGVATLTLTCDPHFVRSSIVQGQIVQHNASQMILIQSDPWIQKDERGLDA